MTLVRALPFLFIALPAMALGDVVADLTARLARDGAEAVNAHLSSNWEIAMTSFSRRVVLCDPRALRLALQLHRSTNAEATQAHAESLRIAAGRCPASLLPLVPLDEIVMYCGASGVVGDSQYEPEVTRRIATIEKDAVLSKSTSGRACVAAYKEEARRVGLGAWQGDQHVGRPTR